MDRTDHELDALIAAADAPPSASTHLASVSAEGCMEQPLALVDELWWVLDDSDGAESTPESAADFTQRRSVDDASDAKQKQQGQRGGGPNKGSSAYRRVVASRRRAKEELDHLRRRVAELETQLKDAVAAARESTSTPKDAFSSSVDLFWRRLAQTELEARQRAVTENFKLRRLLESQLRTAKQLEKLLNKRQADVAGVANSSNSESTAKRVRRDNHDDEKGIFDLLVADLEVRYPLVDTVLDECGLSQRKEAFQDARIRYEVDGDTQSSCLEFVTATIVPFDFGLTRDVAWRALQAQTIPLENGMYEVIEATDDLVKAVFTIHTKLRGSDAVSIARFVARRHDEANRTVVMWGLAATIRGGILKNHRVELREEGWSVVSRLASTGPSEMSLTQACGRLRPQMVIRSGSKLDELVGILTDTLLDCYHDTQRGLYDFTGRMLLAEASQKQAAMEGVDRS